MTKESIEQLMLMSIEIDNLKQSKRLGSDEIFLLGELEKRIQKIINNEL